MINYELLCVCDDDSDDDGVMRERAGGGGGVHCTYKMCIESCLL